MADVPMDNVAVSMPVDALVQYESFCGTHHALSAAFGDGGRKRYYD
jgi:hypothetical protein